MAQGGSLFQPLSVPVTYGTALEDLSPGLYVIEMDSDTSGEELRYVSVDTEQEGRLLLVNDHVYLRWIFYSMGKTRVLGGYPRTASRFLFDLSRQQSFQVPVCPEGSPEPSPSGLWLITMCIVYGEVQEGKVEVEGISLEDGTGFYLEIPSHSRKRYASSEIHWISDERFIANVGPDDEPCLISVPDLGMRCAPVLKDKPIRSVSENLLTVERSRGQIWIIEIYHMECFEDNSKCDPIMTIDDDFLGSALLTWAPSEAMLGLVSSAGLRSLTSEIGYYDTATWEYHPLATLSGDYLFVDWCPDSSCILVRENAKTSGYIIFVDGNLKQLEFDGFPLKFIEIP
jgi:hypothetical protein